jgi:hypothetical protein
MHRRSGSRRLAAATLSLSALGLAGCGHAARVGTDRTLTVGLTEYRVTPQEARLSQGLLTIVVHNYGKLTHNLSVSLDGVPEGATPPIPAGQSADLALQLAPGRYDMSSTLLSDEALGEYGTLTVTR